MRPPILQRFSERRLQRELMDQPEIDRADHVAALLGLARINWLSRSDAILWPSIKCVARGAGGSMIRVLDIASGGGDVPINLARRSARSKLNIRIDGCDMSPRAVEFARAAAKAAGLPVGFFPLDALNDPLPAGYDVVTCSLFLHHLGDADAVTFLRKAAGAASRLLLINDLARDPLAYALAWAGCHLLTRSPVVWHDGPVSVAGAFSLAEARAVADRAGLEEASLVRRWPRRFLLSWSR